MKINIVDSTIFFVYVSIHPEMETRTEDHSLIKYMTTNLTDVALTRCPLPIVNVRRSQCITRPFYILKHLTILILKYVALITIGILTNFAIYFVLLWSEKMVVFITIVYGCNNFLISGIFFSISRLSVSQ